LASELRDPVLTWFKVRAPMLALLLTILGVLLNTYARLTAVEVRQQMMEQRETQMQETLERIEMRLVVGP
jgi:hypothetical protein